jgi:2-dehydro-3-deoxygalactonokinase
MDLARHMQRVSPNLLEVTELFLVPGVRTGMLSADLEATLRSDMMRGEETLVVGLLATRRMQANGLLLNLGSHWKWIWVDNQKRIARSRTTLTGELIHATQSHTLLASGLPQIKPSELNEEWLERGGQEARQHGLSRALFSLRLLEQAGHGTPEERLSFLYGSFLEMELLAFSQDKLLDAESICLVGSHALTAVFKRKLERLSRNVQIISEEDRDDSYLEGLRRLFSLARQHGLEAPVTSLS